MQRAVKSHCAFSCKSDYGKAVRTVRCNLKFHHMTLHGKQFLYICSRHCIAKTDIAQNQNTIFCCTGHFMQCKPHFFKGAQHSLADFSTQLSLFDFYITWQQCTVQGNRHQCAFKHIFCASNNLQRIFPANIY